MITGRRVSQLGQKMIMRYFELLGVEKRAPENDSNFKDSESIYFLVD